MAAFLACGAVAEWSKALAWKVSIRQNRIEGSNPSRSANSSTSGSVKHPIEGVALDRHSSVGSRAIDIFWEAIALTIGSLLPIMNPFSTAPLFVSLTAGASKEVQKRQALFACIYAFGILATFLLIGAAIIDFFGISVPGLRVAGGLIISVIGFRMLFPAPPSGGSSDDHPKELEIAFTPLAMPSLAGPGSISVVLTAAAQIRSVRPNDFVLIYGAVLIGMALTLVFSYFVLRASTAMVRFMGKSGIDAMTRIFGFLLIAIGMQFLLTGISDFYGIAHP